MQRIDYIPGVNAIGTEEIHGIYRRSCRCPFVACRSVYDLVSMDSVRKASQLSVGIMPIW